MDGQGVHTFSQWTKCPHSSLLQASKWNICHTPASGPCFPSPLFPRRETIAEVPWPTLISLLGSTNGQSAHFFLCWQMYVVNKSENCCHFFCQDSRIYPPVLHFFYDSGIRPPAKPFHAITHRWDDRPHFDIVLRTHIRFIRSWRQQLYNHICACVFFRFYVKTVWVIEEVVTTKVIGLFLTNPNVWLF